MGIVSTIWSDFAGISRVCGVMTALHWSTCICRSVPSCLAHRNLQSADRLMGLGPFRVKRQAARAALLGEQVFSGLREIWVRDVYLTNDFLEIAPSSFVMDLGANLGNFSLLALAHSGVRVLAFEPSRRLSQSLSKAVAYNGWADRLMLERSFVGDMTEVQLRVMNEDPEYQGVGCLSEAALIDKYQIRQIDFLKCDIEGSEFFLLEPHSRLLSMTRQIAIELHPWGGNVQQFIDRLRADGFTIGPTKYDASGTCILLAKRN